MSSGDKSRYIAHTSRTGGSVPASTPQRRHVGARGLHLRPYLKRYDVVR